MRWRAHLHCLYPPDQVGTLAPVEDRSCHFNGPHLPPPTDPGQLSLDVSRGGSCVRGQVVPFAIEAARPEKLPYQRLRASPVTESNRNRLFSRVRWCRELCAHELD